MTTNLDRLAILPQSLGVQGPYCAGCDNRQAGIRMIPPDGKGYSGVMIVGDGGWDYEAKEGRPFAGPAGQFLDKHIFRRLGVQRDAFTLTNTTWCFPEDVVIEARSIRRGYKRHYVGPLATVTCTGGSLTGTPNHPTLTQRGWVALGEVHQGDYLVHSAFSEGVVSVNPYPDCAPTKFGKLFSTLEASGISQWMIGTDTDFHGDGGRDANIQIVTLDRQLLHGSKVLWEHLEKLVFEAAYTRTYLEGFGRCYGTLLDNLSSLLSSLYCSMSTGCEFHPILSGGICIANLGRLSGCPHDLEGSQNTPQGSFGDTVLPDDVFRGLPVGVKFDEVLNVQSAEFTGLVHNLEASSGQYIANGYTVSNCKAPRLNFYDYAGPEATAIIEHCRPYLDELIDKVKPRVIIPMGNVALRRVCNVSGIQAHQCYVVDTPYGIPAVPTFHPSWVQQDQLKFTPCMLFAFRKAIAIAKES